MDNENEIVLIAIDSITCEGCIFDNEESNCTSDETKINHVPCSPSERKDGRNVIWVKKETK